MALAALRRFAAAARGLIGMLLLCCLAVTPVAAQTVDPVRLAQLEAAYLVNFARYTDWPPRAFADADSPLVILVHGNPDLVEAMRLIVSQAKPIAGRAIRVRSTRARDGAMTDLAGLIARCHVLFIDDGAAADIGRLLAHARTHAVLTVSDSPQFTRAGGMFEFVRSGARVVFDANPDAIRAAGLNVSSRVLKLARQLAGTG